MVVRNKRKHSSTATPKAPEKNQPKLMAVLEASKDDRQNAAQEKPPRKEVKTVHQVTLKDRPKVTVSSDTIPDDSDDPGACSENAAPEKNYTKLGKGSTAEQLDGTTLYTNCTSKFHF